MLSIDYMMQFKGWWNLIQENWDGEREPCIQRRFHFQTDFETLFWCAGWKTSLNSRHSKLNKSSKQPCTQMHMSALWTECFFPLQTQINFICWIQTSGWYLEMGLWGVIRVRVGPDGGALIMGLMALLRRGRERGISISVSPPYTLRKGYVRTQENFLLKAKKSALTRNWISKTLSLDF